MDDFELLSSDDEDKDDIVKNLVKETAFALQQVKSEYEEMRTIGGLNDAGARRGSLQWSDKKKLAQAQSVELGAATSTSSDVSTDPYSSSGEDAFAVVVHPVPNSDIFMDHHNQKYAEYIKNKELEQTMDPQETASRLASQRQEYARGLHTLSKHHLYAGFNGTPAGTAVSSMTSSKKGSASSSTLDKVEKMVDEKKRKKEKKGGGSFWCCGSGH
jgi:hypothetical protein